MSQSVYSVSSLNRYVKLLLDRDMNLTSILVKGEVSNFTNHRSGHWYFTLKDRTSKISCVMFASYACKSKILLKEGMQIIIHGSLSMYEAQGSCQLFVTSVQIDGLGDLYLELEQTKERMRKEGFFAEEHKQILPTYPMKIGVVTAKTGAAIQDILSTIARRWPIADVQVFPTLVQGTQASSAIIESLKIADDLDFDVILLARGGGAIEDLWCFNDASLATFIYEMKTPIVTGVGHETDTTLVDYVSDARAPTPTAAAELITPNIEDIQMKLTQLKQRMESQVQYMLEQKRLQLDHLKQHRYLKDPLVYIQHQRLQLAMITKSLEQTVELTHQKQIQFQSIRQRFLRVVEKKSQLERSNLQRKDTQLRQLIDQSFEQKQQALKEKVLLLDAFSPLKILGRGYSITYKNDMIIHSTKEVKPKDSLTLRLHDGQVDVEVTKVKGT